MTTSAAMQKVGEINGRKVYWAEPGRFATPGIHYWDEAAQQHVHTNGFDLGTLLPVLFHTAEDAGRFITAGVVIVRDPETDWINFGT